MIGRLTGTLLEKHPPTICLDVQGVGYEIDVPMSTLYDLPDLGARVTLFTHLAVREDAHVLYGFLRAEERNVFRALIKVTGIGARTALAVLSGMSVQELASAITRQETALLMRVPGIGKKTAERLLLELRGKLGADIGAAPGSVPSGREDIINALLALGYSSAETQAALKALPEGVEISEGIRLALQSLSRH
ncbi:Holliday junction branch migration protein RuvA [Pusillimonas sp. CC-YST705]|uniref:Holliday junction branch migration complex subunit RuvA n=1 Tax=Mesopusillimonas faecipullorum TaxID=2755040 RepID=A0ABS8C8M7_9BURK|nr:Holliday junction branch migration protein RuvA [Mesopusillimonas faecipullorum]MCB5362209.1 Holliday junction branch migration protein RuvA [Mesopusillimonas faecipullorum]